MTVEKAIRDWYEYRMGGTSKGGRPSGYAPLGGDGEDDGCNPFFAGWHLVDQAIRSVAKNDDIGTIWLSILLGGGTREALHDKAERIKIEIAVEVNRLIKLQPSFKEFEKS